MGTNVTRCECQKLVKWQKAFLCTKPNDSLKECNVLSIQLLIRLELCKFAYKFKYNLLPTIVEQLFHKGSDFHCYETCNRNQLRIKKHTSSILIVAF